MDIQQRTELPRALSWGVEIEHIHLVEKEHGEFSLSDRQRLASVHQHFGSLPEYRGGREFKILHAVADKLPELSPLAAQSDSNYGENDRQDWVYSQIGDRLNEVLNEELPNKFGKVVAKTDYSDESIWAPREANLDPRTGFLKTCANWYLARENYCMSKTYERALWGPFLPIGCELVSSVQKSNVLSSNNPMSPSHKWYVDTDSIQQIRAITHALTHNWLATTDGVTTRKSNGDEYKARPSCHVHVGLVGEKGRQIHYTSCDMKRIGILSWLAEPIFMHLLAPWRRCGRWSNNLENGSFAADIASKITSHGGDWKNVPAENWSVPDQYPPGTSGSFKVDPSQLNMDLSPKFEKEFFDHVPAEIRDNLALRLIWAQSSRTNTALMMSKNGWIGRVGMGFRELVDPITTPDKGTALGTVEFRHNGSTLDSTQISYWVEFCLRYIDICVRSTPSQFQDLVRRVLGELAESKHDVEGLPEKLKNIELEIEQLEIDREAAVKTGNGALAGEKMAKKRIKEVEFNKTEEPLFERALRFMNMLGFDHQYRSWWRTNRNWGPMIAPEACHIYGMPRAPVN